MEARNVSGNGLQHTHERQAIPASTQETDSVIFFAEFGHYDLHVRVFGLQHVKHRRHSRLPGEVLRHEVWTIEKRPQSRLLHEGRESPSLVLTDVPVPHGELPLEC